jgi:hypothetical protein
MNNELNVFLEQLTYGTSYRVLEMGMDDEEIKAIAKKHHLKFPNRSIAIIKGKFAFTDEQNRNGCTLPREEVVKAIDSIGGTAIDFDHFRKRVVGYWLEGYLEASTIYSYGIFFKGNFPQEFEKIKELFNEGSLKISFEAWGDRIVKSEGKYDLTNVEFAGGALLLAEHPAFPNAEVMEMAKTWIKPESFIVEEGKQVEKARLYNFDMSAIERMLSECHCEDCQGYLNPDMIDFENSKATATCINCKAKYDINLKPEQTKTGYSISSISKLVKQINMEDSKMDEKQIKELTDKLATLEGASVAKDTELAAVKSELEAAKTKIAELEAIQVAASEETKKAVELAKKNATIVAERKAELGEFAKDMKDEDILDDLKFENAKLKKENSELKAKKLEEAKEIETGKTKEEVKLETGSKDKVSEVFKSQKRIKEFAFGA